MKGVMIMQQKRLSIVGLCLKIIGVCFVAIIAILLIRTLQFAPQPLNVAPAIELDIDEVQMSNRLASALRFKTISYQDSTKIDEKTFLALHEYLEKAFPNVHAELEKEKINKYSLLYTWKGKDEKLKPILFLAHQDVVPVAQETENDWAYPPFAGRIAEGHIWGRGALDDKSSLMGILEAIEILVKNSFQPMRTIFLAFGHDEEIMGANGAEKIAQTLKSRNIKYEYIIDEGGIITQDIIPGVKLPIALIGISEKGYVSLELKVKAEGGHSSIPPKHTTIGILSRAITKLEENPFPANMTYPSQFFSYIGPYMPFAKKIIFANLWLFKPLVKHILSKTPEMNAGIRTTTAATMFNSGEKENILPIQATAVVNFRIMPGENPESVLRHVKRIIDDNKVQIKSLPFACEPPPVSNISSTSYKIVKKTIQQMLGDKEVIVAPFLFPAATDSRYYTDLSENVYRFFPAVSYPEDLNRAHGTNERISIENYVQAVKFYYQLIRNSDEL